MTLVMASIEIAAPPERVLEVALDPDRLDEWVTIHRRVDHSDGGSPRAGYEMEQTLVLRGAPFRVHWSLTEYSPSRSATWEGRGPAHSYARTAYRLTALDGGRSRFDYENEFRAPGGVLGAVASRALIGGIPEREAHRSLAKLKALLEQ